MHKSCWWNKVNNFCLPVNPNKPMFGSVSLFEIRQIEVFVSYDSISGPVISSRHSAIKSGIRKAIVGQFVHLRGRK